MTALVILATAMICLPANRCYPVLIGRDTPVGVFTVQHKDTSAPGYGGDVLEFYENETSIYAIHRVWLLKPKQHRLERLASKDVSKRKNVTGGCINVMPEVYELLKNIDQVEIR